MNIYPVKQSQVVELPRFFSESLCADYVKQAKEAGFAQQEFYGGETRARATFDSTQMAQDLLQRLPDLPSLDEFYGPLLRPDPDVNALSEFKASGLNERFRFYEYSEGARFSLHHDISYEAVHARSFLTLLIYLNEGMVGGETTFEDELTITPQLGTCILFPHELMHQGLPVTSGTKVVLRSDVMFTHPSLEV